MGISPRALSYYLAKCLHRPEPVVTGATVTNAQGIVLN